MKFLENIFNNGNIYIYLFGIIITIILFLKIHRCKSYLIFKINDIIHTLKIKFTDMHNLLADNKTNTDIMQRSIEKAIEEIKNQMSSSIKDSKFDAEDIDDLKYKVSIYCKDEDNKNKLVNLINDQLKDSKDYEDCNIIFNTDEENIIDLYIFDESQIIPQLMLTNKIEEIKFKTTKSSSSSKGGKLKELPENTNNILEKWMNGEITATEASKQLGICTSTFFNRFGSRKNPKNS